VSAASQRLDLDRLLAEAVETTGHDDLGEDTWREGAERLVPDFLGPAQLSEIGVEVVAADLLTYVTNRLEVIAWRKAHPEVADVQIARPIVIVGQPRTGTTILYDLLAQDPRLRVPRSWEVDRPVPAPEPATYDSDPRIAQVQANYDMVDMLIPGFSAFHEVGATLGQECVRITAGDFRSMIFPTQYVTPDYNTWLLHEADLGPAYRWHRLYLQHLGSRVTGQRWLLKSPVHLWHLPDLAAAYPDAVLIQTHRDPLKVISSISALTANLRRLASDAATIPHAAKQYVEDIPLGLDRAVRDRDAGVFPANQVVDVHFAEFVADPLGRIARIYTEIGMELPPEVEQRMKAFLTDHPGDGGGGGSRYSFADTCLDEATVRDRCAAYCARFDVALEPAT
jgi:hypothetical protein